MKDKQKEMVLELLQESWSRAYKAQASSEILAAIEAAIDAVEQEQD